MQWVFVEETDTLMSASQIETICAMRIEDKNGPRTRDDNSVGLLELIHYGENAIPRDTNWRVAINHRNGCHTWIGKISLQEAKSKVREIVRKIAETNDNIVLAKDGSVNSFKNLCVSEQANESTTDPTVAQSQKPPATKGKSERLKQEARDRKVRDLRHGERVPGPFSTNYPK